jgi:hypothetical protein
MRITRETIDALRTIAQTDQCDDPARPWTFTYNCHQCGGIGEFFDWLDKNLETLEEVKA